MKLEICNVRAINGNQQVVHDAMEALLDRPLGELNPDRRRKPQETLEQYNSRFAEISDERQCWKLVDWDMSLRRIGADSFWVVIGDVEFLDNAVGQSAQKVLQQKQSCRIVPRITSSDISGTHLSELFAVDIIVTQ